MKDLMQFLIDNKVELTLDRKGLSEFENEMYDTILKLRSELKTAKEIISKLEECVVFYSNPMIYFSDHEGGGFSYITEDDQEDLEIAIPEFNDTEPDWYENVGGKKARSTLLEVEQMKKKMGG